MNQSFKSSWWKYSSLFGIPFFIGLCLDFLYRASNINTFWDGLLSFFLLNLLFFGSALFLGLLAACIESCLKWSWIERICHVAIAWLTIVIFLTYTKKLALSFTYADEFGKIVIGKKYALSLATILMGFILLLLRNPRLRPKISATWDRILRRTQRLSAAVSMMGFIALTGSFILSQRSAQPSTPLPKEDGVHPKNVLLLVVDTLSAKHLSPYGYTANSTPNFDRLSRLGYFFLNARANVTSTGPSIASILTGKSPMESHILGFHSVPGEISSQNLSSFLEERGYKTESITENRYATFHHHGFPLPTEGETNLIFDKDFNEMTNRINRALAAMGRKLGFSMKYQITEFVPWADTPFSTAFAYFAERMRELRSSSKKPFFLFTHIFLPASIRFEPGVAPSIEEYPAPYGPEQRARVQKAKRSYDRAISDLDANMGAFFDVLSQEGFLRDTVVIITADHGEAFDKGFWGHGDDLSEDSIKVPLFIFVPTGEPRVIREAVQSCDIAPTILGFLGLEKPAWMDCVSVMEQRKDAPVTFNFLAKSSVQKIVPYPGISSGRSISIYKEPFKLIQRPDPDNQELYDLSSDPDETTNLAHGLSEKVHEMHSDLNRILYPSQAVTRR